MDENLDKLKNRYIEKWGGLSPTEVRLQKFSDEFENWISRFSTEAKPIVIKLLDHFEYYSRRVTNKWLETLHKQLLKAGVISDEDTIYAFIKSKDGISNSSNDYWTEYKSLNNLNLNLCYENIDAITDKQWTYISNSVFIDDCSGTGKSFLDEIKKRPDRYKHKNVYFISIHIMKDALKNIDQYAKNNDINIVCIKAVVQGKAFSDEIFDNNDLAKKIIIDISSEYGIPSVDILGFKESESLMAFYNNTPNNTLGLIRYDTEKYHSIFPRRNDPKPEWQHFKRGKSLRKIENFNGVKRNHQNG